MPEQEKELQYRDPVRMVRRLRDGLAAELTGLNEDNAIEALLYAEDRLANELQLLRLCLAAAAEERADLMDRLYHLAYGPEDDDDDATEA